jgi:hypothetical protein
LIVYFLSYVRHGSQPNVELIIFFVTNLMLYNLLNKLCIRVGFEVLTAVSTKMAVFWVVAPWSLVEVYQRFRGPCYLHHQGDETTRRYNPEDSHQTKHRIKAKIYIWLYRLNSHMQDVIAVSQIGISSKGRSLFASVTSLLSSEDELNDFKHIVPRL